MSIEELNIFVTVAQTLNFTQAAEKLHFSQPTLSRHISDLEKELGYDLLIRTTRKVELTEFGRYFLVEAKRLLRSYNQLLEQLTNLGKQSFGSLTIATPDLMTRSFLPAVIRSFSKKYPGVMIDVRIIEPGACINLLKNKVIDLGFFASTDSEVPQPNNIQLETVSSGNLILVTGLSHRLSDKAVVQAEELSQERIYITNRNNTPYLWNTVTQFLTHHDLTTDILEEVDSPNALIMLVEAGLGVTILASNLIQELGNLELLHLAKLEAISAPSHLLAAWSRSSDNPCLPQFIEELHQVRQSRL